MKKLIQLTAYILVIAASIFYFISNLNLKKPSKPDCEIVDDKKHIYKNQCLPDNYKPQVLTELSRRASYLTTYQYLDIRAKIAVEKLIDDAEKDGICLIVMSSYRSYNDQAKLLEHKNHNILDKIAPVGRSEHHTGLAVDFGGCPMSNGERDDRVERLELKKDFDELPEYQWLLENADNYGFEQSYREDNRELTGYPNEPWHWKMIVR